jgi:hypothetical protein
MADIPSHPKIFGDLRLAQLHISGAVYHTVGDAPSTPTLIVLTNKTRRWELVISDAYETDRTGKPINRAPQASTPPAQPSHIIAPADVLCIPLKAMLAPETPEGQRVRELEAQLDAEQAAHDKLSDEWALLLTAKAEVDEKLAQDRRIISDQQAELVRLRSNHNLTDKETNHVHVPCPCTVPPTPHCQWCGATLPIEPEPDCKLCELVGKAVSHCVKCSHAFGAPPEPDEDRIREAREKRDESDERRHDAARQHAEGG